MFPSVAEIDKVKADPKAKSAQAVVAGVLRGGTVLGGYFYTCTGNGPIAVPLGYITRLKYLGEGGTYESD